MVCQTIASPLRRRKPTHFQCTPQSVLRSPINNLFVLIRQKLRWLHFGAFFRRQSDGEETGNHAYSCNEVPDIKWVSPDDVCDDSHWDGERESNLRDNQDNEAR